MTSVRRRCLGALVLCLWFGAAVVAQETVVAPDDVVEEQIIYSPGWPLRVRAYVYTPPGEGPFPLLIWNHGGAMGVLGYTRVMCRAWAARGYVVGASEFRGQGRSSGVRVIRGKEADDVLALIDVLCERDTVDARRLFMIGHSFGGGVTLHTCTRTNRLCAAVAASAWTDLANWGKRRPQLDNSTSLLARFLHRHSPITHMEDLGCPLLIVHGRKDPTVGFLQAELLAERLDELGKPFETMWLDDAQHGTPQRPDVTQRILAFFAAHDPGPTS